VRAAQWLRMCSTYDRWPRFLKAVQRWTDAQGKPAADQQRCDKPADPIEAGGGKTDDALEPGADTPAQADDDSSQNAACSSCGNFSHASNASPLCPYHGKARGALPWPVNAQDRKDTAMHIQELGGKIRHRSQLAWRPLPTIAACERVEVKGEEYRLGSASGSSNNCLIDTLRQCMGIDANIARVRRDMQQEFCASCGPTCDRFGKRCAQGCSRVWPDNFLCLDLHWRAIIRLLGKHCSWS